MFGVRRFCCTFGVIFYIFYPRVHCREFFLHVLTPIIKRADTINGILRCRVGRATPFAIMGSVAAATSQSALILIRH